MSRRLRLGLFRPRCRAAHRLTDRIEPKLRPATDIVTALNFDIRAFDTLGEEFILFASVAGVALYVVGHGFTKAALFTLSACMLRFVRVTAG